MGFETWDHPSAAMTLAARTRFFQISLFVDQTHDLISPGSNRELLRQGLGVCYVQAPVVQHHAALCAAEQLHAKMLAPC